MEIQDGELEEESREFIPQKWRVLENLLSNDIVEHSIVLNVTQTLGF